MQRCLGAVAKTLAAVVAAGAATVLLATPAVHGYPIAPECNGHWTIPGYFRILQDNKLYVDFSAADNRASAPCSA